MSAGAAVLCLAAGLVSGALCRLLLPALTAAARTGGAVRRNYRGRLVPVSVGVAPSLATSGVLGLLAGLGFVPSPHALALVGASLGFALFGWLDDAWGDRSVRGLRGHLGSILQGQWTTGGLKAVGGVGVALVTGVILAVRAGDDGTGQGTGWLGSLLLAGLVATCANAVNLLDVQPGRAVKGLAAGWLIFLGVSAAKGAGAEPWIVAAAALGGLAVYAPWDLHEEAMLGDAGANSQGALLGAALAAALGTFGAVTALAALLALHVYTENHSLSRLIERVPVLRRIDGWGRRP